MQNRIAAVIAFVAALLSAPSAFAVGERGECRYLKYDTQVHLEATTPPSGECTIGYALDTNQFELREGDSWVALGTLTAITGTNLGTIANGTNHMWDISENSETVRLDFSTGNQVTVSSATGVSVLLTAFDLSLSGGAAAIGFTAASSSILLSGSADNAAAGLDIGSTGATSTLRIISTNSAEGIAVTGTASVSGATTLTGAAYANGGVDRSTAAALAIGGANATAVNITPATNITGLTTATGGLSTTKPLFVYNKVRFCGNGSNGTTPWFIGPVLNSDVTDFSVGSAGCDGNDSGTEATADRPYDAYTTLKIVGMQCVTQAGGTSNTNTFQMRTAGTTDVTGVTCTVTNDGSLPKTCSVILAAPVTISANATLAVKNVQSGSDDMSAKDAECTGFFTY